MSTTFKLLFYIFLIAWNINNSNGQSIFAQSFVVGGDFDKFYPVVFSETNWYDGATEFELSRSAIHTDSDWRGSLIAKFRVHTTRWGNGSHFIDADIKNVGNNFIADWRDGTSANGTADVILWLRGGGTTYYFRSTNSSMLLPTVYINGFQEVNGPSHTYKTEINKYVNTNGATFTRSVYVHGNEVVFGYVGIGKTDPQNALDVNGTVHAKEVKVDLTGWSDFVFHPTCQLKPLSEVEQFIKTNGHLQDIPSAGEVEQDGVNVGEMQKKLLQKVEELTLYLIEKDKQISNQNQIIFQQQKLLMDLKKEIENLKQN